MKIPPLCWKVLDLISKSKLSTSESNIFPVFDELIFSRLTLNSLPVNSIISLWILFKDEFDNESEFLFQWSLWMTVNLKHQYYLEL